MSTSQGQVRIGREFFAKIKNDYSDWRFALVREFLQNCFDAPKCNETSITIEAMGDGLIKMVVTNNGDPMTRDILVNKLLTLGGSGKNFDGENTGGFGVAKSLLYYMHESYAISTGSLRVEGSGGDYSISTGPYFAGTQSTIIINCNGSDIENEMGILKRKILRFASLAQWRGRLLLNGEHLQTNTHKGHRRRDLGWAVVHTNQQASNLCVIRLNGQPMFTRYSRFKGCVQIELTGKASQTLTSNRDGLLSKYANELSDLLTALGTDKKSALREQKAAYKRYAGEIQRNEAKKPKESELSLTDIIGFDSLSALLQKMPANGPGPRRSESEGENGHNPHPPGIRVLIESRGDEPDRSISVGPQFILKNTTGMTIPCWYVPGEKFTQRSRELVRSWTAILLKLYQITNLAGEFSVGFCFDEESEAEHETGIYGRVYYLNPVKIISDGKIGGKQKIVTRFDGAWQDRFTLISLACHEFVHGAYGLAEHDEEYANRLTEIITLALKHSNELQKLCSQSLGTQDEMSDDDNRTKTYLSKLCGMTQEQSAKLN